MLVSACLIAMFIQYLSAKTGLATGRDLPTLCRESFLFGVPLFPTALITAVPGFAILALRRRGYRPFELAIAFLLGAIAFGFVHTLFALGGPSVPGLAAGMVTYSRVSALLRRRGTRWLIAHYMEAPFHMEDWDRQGRT